MNGNINRETVRFLNAAITASENFDTTLKLAIETGDPKVNTLFTIYQELLAHFKTNIVSILNIIVTPTDNDGD